MTDLLKRIDEGLDACGITNAPWGIADIYHTGSFRKSVYGNGNGFRSNLSSCVCAEDARLIAQCREAFKALILYVYQADKLPPLSAIEGALEDEYRYAIKVIEVGTGWTWSEWKEWIDG